MKRAGRSESRGCGKWKGIGKRPEGREKKGDRQGHSLVNLRPSRKNSLQSVVCMGVQGGCPSRGRCTVWIVGNSPGVIKIDFRFEFHTARANNIPYGNRPIRNCPDRLYIYIRQGVVGNYLSISKREIDIKTKQNKKWYQQIFRS